MKPRTFNSGKAFFLLFILSAIVLIHACSKSNSYSSSNPQTTNSFVSVSNASPSTTAYGVFSDTTSIYTAGTLAYGSTTGVSGANPYATITSGKHIIKLTSVSNTIILDSSTNFTASGHYSYFAYDTGNVKTLALKDNLTPPSSGNAEVRFLNLSPNSQLVNLWLLHTDTTMKDSTSFTNVGYVGSSGISTDSLASFKTITAGTYKVLINSNTDLNLFQNDSVTFASGKIYTIYARGYLNTSNSADSLGLGVIQNY